MQDKADVREVRENDPNARARQIKRLERMVTQVVSDKDYRSIYLPCLPLDGSIKHWR